MEANERKVGSDGLIRLDQVTGSDEYICRVARSTSGADRNKLPEDDKGLLRYLVRHMHTTPVEFGEGVFFLRIQVDAWRQMVRHRTASINEYCLAPGTRVLTADLTWVAVETIKVGDRLVGFGESPLRLRRNRFAEAEVTAVTPQELRRYVISTPDGTVTASADHLWVARRNREESYRWVKTADLELGFEVAFTVKPWEKRTDYNAGWLAGLLDGEGWFSVDPGRSFHVGFAQNDGPVLDKARTLLEQYGVPHICFDQQSGNGRCRTVSVSRKYEALRLLGEVRPVRLLSKCVNAWMQAGRVTAYPSRVGAISSIGLGPVVGLSTTTNTLVAEGFLSHNSTRYRPAIDEAFALDPDQWRTQSKTNRQGSSGGTVTEWPAGYKREKIKDYTPSAGPDGTSEWIVDPRGNPICPASLTPGEYLSRQQDYIQAEARKVYEERLEFGVAFEAARKDLPLSTYTELYWKCDLNNIFKFLSLRMHSHAQKEIRSYAEAMYDLLRPHFPMLFEAFDDFDPRRGGLLLSRLDVEVIKGLVSDLVGDPNRDWASMFGRHDQPLWQEHEQFLKDQGRKTTSVGERQECIEKLKRLGLLPADFVRG